MARLLFQPIIRAKLKKRIKSLVICKSARWVSIIVATGLLQGCMVFSIGGYGPDGQSKEEFEQRVEAAFRLENRMTSEIMALQGEESDVKNLEAVFLAEQIMEKNCADLNDYVSRDIDGLSQGFLLQKRVENSVLNCETAAKRVEALLKSH